MRAGSRAWKLRVVVGCVALMALGSCGDEPTAPPSGLLGGGPLNAAILGDLLLYVQPALDAEPVLWIVSNRADACSHRVLALRRLSSSEQSIPVNASGPCGTFTLELVHRPAAVCQPGGLYLVRGFVGASSYENETLLSWNDAFEPTTPPTVLAAASEPAAPPAPSWPELGRWNYVLEVAAPNVPAECRVTTELSVSLQAVGTSPPPERTFRYSIEETNLDGQFAATVSPQTADAPPLAIEASAGSRRIRLSGLDALRDATVEASLAFGATPPFASPRVAAPTVHPAIRIQNPLPLAPDPLANPKPTERYLQDFLGQLGSSLRTLAGSAEAQVSATASVTYVVGTDPLVPLRTSLPIVLTPPELVALDDTRSCDADGAPQGFLCRLIASVLAFRNAHPELPENAEYLFQFRVGGALQAPAFLLDATVFLPAKLLPR